MLKVTRSRGTSDGACYLYGEGVGFCAAHVAYRDPRVLLSKGPHAPVARHAWSYMRGYVESGMRGLYVRSRQPNQCTTK